MTGLHTVADIYCTCCNTVLGWKYVSTRHSSHYTACKRYMMTESVLNPVPGCLQDPATKGPCMHHTPHNNLYTMYSSAGPCNSANVLTL